MSEEPTEAFRRKIARKFALRRWVGELYVGKRMKMHALSRRLDDLRPPEGGRVLEVGSEDGCFTEWIDRRWPEVTVEGLEQDRAHAESTRRWAVEHGRTPKLSFRQGDLRQLSAPGQYDVIFCLDVLGYIPDDRQAVQALAAALKPRGRLVVHQPNIRYRRFSGQVQEVSPELAGQITVGHLRHGYAPEGLRALLEDAGGLQVERLEPWHGRFSDLAHRVFLAMEHPAVLRFVALPIVDLLWWLDQRLPGPHGNTVFAVARRPAGS